MRAKDLQKLSKQVVEGDVQRAEEAAWKLHDDNSGEAVQVAVAILRVHHLPLQVVEALEELLVQTGHSAAEELVALLTDRDAPTRSRETAAIALGALGYRRAIGPLLETTRDAAPTLAGWAVLALQQLGAPEAPELAARLLGSTAFSGDLHARLTATREAADPRG